MKIEYSPEDKEYIEKTNKLILEKFKNKLYDLIYLPNSTYEQELDEALLKALQQLWYGGLHTKAWLVGELGVKEFDVDTINWDKYRTQVEDLRNELVRNKYFTIITGTTIINTIEEKQQLQVIFFVITNKWTGVIVIPIKKVIKPAEGLFFPFSIEMIDDVKIDYGYSENLRHPLNFYYLLENASPLIIA